MALRDLLQGFGLEALDDETIEYMVSAVADAEDDEELTDILAPFLEDPAHLSAAIDAVKGHKRFGFNYDPSHLGYQGVDSEGIQSAMSALL